MIPEKIGRYEIKAELGRGGMATVYRGYDPRFEREVAVKVLPRELLHADPQFRMRFEREAKIIAQLEHPSIVPVYDVGEDDGQPYFVMRFMNGGDLSARIKQRPYTVEETIRILEQIAPGLDQAHAKGIVHRDLKPSNILFDSADAPYISDFGIAKLAQGQSTNVTGSAIIGTPAYMAPEQAQGDKIDHRADIYAVGTILYEMLTGRQPYEADTPMGVVVKHITEPVPNILDVNPLLPSYVEAIIQKALAKNKEHRFATTKELVDALRTGNVGVTLQISSTQLPGGKTATMPRPQSVGPSPAGGRFNPLSVIIPVVLLVALLGGTYMLFGTNKATPMPEPTTPVVTAAATATSSPPTATDTPAQATSTSEPEPPTATATNVPPTEIPTATAIVLPTIGGADKIAFMRENDIWTVNVDGSDLTRWTDDGGEKDDLQWLPDGDTLLYTSGSTIRTVNIATNVIDIFATFSNPVFDFRVSPSGNQLAVSLNGDLFILPFTDPQKIRAARTRDQLRALKTCEYTGFAVSAVRWSEDETKVAIQLLVPDGTLQVDAVRVVDLKSCTPILSYDFPAARFEMSGDNDRRRDIGAYDWDGSQIFLLSNAFRNEHYGFIYKYDLSTFRRTEFRPVESTCCYRAPAWSPDKSYVLFFFQDVRLAPAGTTVMYYVPIGDLESGAKLKPFPFQPDFFSRRVDDPVAVLRPARKP